MANERYDDKYEGHEEGEYHFSDDQVNYDLDAESPSKDGTVAAVMPKASIADKIKTHRRIVIGIVIFIILLGIVYKLIMPSSTTPLTDFSQQTTTPTTKATTKPDPVNPASTASQQAPATTTTTTQVSQQTPPPPATMTQQPMTPPAQPIMTAQSTQSIPQPVAPVMTGSENAASKGALDRIATLEQQNSAIMNLLQTQYTQRIAEAEAQNTQLRTQVQELTSRISNMEVAFRQLTKILRIRPPGPAMSETANTMPGMITTAPPPIRVARPRSTYTVQAIIPGRAWLKSEAGDTVTVAEGDMLRGFGRITKIDPYDGIVNIDTGNKVITLSYGTSGD